MKREKFLTLNSSNVISPTLAKINLAKFVLSDDPIDKEDFSKLLVSFYSFCYDKAKQLGGTLPEIEYKTFKSASANYIASVGQRTMSINLSFLDITSKTAMSPENKAELLNTIFHEHSHVMDYNLEQNKHNLSKKFEYNYPLIADEDFEVMFSILNEIEDPNKSKLKNFFDRKKIKKEIKKMHNKNYFFSGEEIRARENGIKFSSEIVESAINTPTNDKKHGIALAVKAELDKGKEYDENHTNRLKDFEFSEDSKSATSQLNHLILNYLTESKNKLMKQNKENPNDKSIHKTYYDFEELAHTLEASLNLNYDQDVANKYFDILIEASSVKMFETGLLADFLNNGNFLPTAEQFESVITVFKNYTKTVEDFTVNPLRFCFNNLNRFDKNLILDCFAKDNPATINLLKDFNYIPCLMVIGDDEIKDLIERYQDKSDQSEKSSTSLFGKIKSHLTKGKTESSDDTTQNPSLDDSSEMDFEE